MAQQLGCAFIETSAKERINVDEAFIGLVGEIKKYQQVSIFRHGGGHASAYRVSLMISTRLELQGIADISLRLSYVGGQISKTL